VNAIHVLKMETCFACFLGIVHLINWEIDGFAHRAFDFF